MTNKVDRLIERIDIHKYLGINIEGVLQVDNEAFESMLKEELTKLVKSERLELLKKVESHRDIVADKVSKTGKTPFRSGKLSAFTQVIQWIESLKKQQQGGGGMKKLDLDNWRDYTNPGEEDVTEIKLAMIEDKINEIIETVNKLTKDKKRDSKFSKYDFDIHDYTERDENNELTFDYRRLSDAISLLTHNAYTDGQKQARIETAERFLYHECYSISNMAEQIITENKDD
jgi:hypothetical protein